MLDLHVEHLTRLYIIQALEEGSGGCGSLLELVPDSGHIEHLGSWHDAPHLLVYLSRVDVSWNLSMSYRVTCGQISSKYNKEEVGVGFEAGYIMSQELSEQKAYCLPLFFSSKALQSYLATLSARVCLLCRAS